MKKRVLALLLAGAFVIQSSAALAAEIDVSEDVIEEDIVLTEDTEEDSGLVVDETAPESEDTTVEDDVQSITVRDVPTSGKCGENVYWAYADEILTISGKGAMNDYTDLSSRPWNDLRNSITNLVIGGGVTEIGNRAFGGLLITTATLGEDVTRIGARAFESCYKLESINIPDGVTRIGEAAFENCRNLESINIPDGVTAIESNTFRVCYSLKELVLPDGVTSIGAHAFRECSSLESINIPDGVTSIGEDAFRACGNLESINIPDGVTSIGAHAFRECRNLKSINIPDGVTAIERSTFVFCYNLKELVLPESVQSLGESSLVVTGETGTGGLTLTVLNPKCVFNNPEMRGGTIRGHEGSTAQAYANSDGDITFVAIDTWDNGTVTTAPTCTEKGVKTYHCTNSDCTATKTEKIEINPDNHDWSDWEVTTPATCTSEGKKERHCTNTGCEKTETENIEINPNNHDWSEWKVTTPATCNKDGVETRTCKNDKTHTETRKIPATGKHTYATTITKAKPGKDGSIVSKCTVCGKVESKTAISAPQKIVLSKTAYTYSGKAKNPTITVKDAAGKTISSSNYTVSYATTRKSVGTHKVTVTFKGSKYTGTLTTKFVINPKAPSIRSASNLVKGVKVTWKPVSGITGYQIQLSTNKSFRNSKIISASKTATSKKITGLSTGTISKKYYVRVRTYKKVSGNWYYSDWSSAKSAHAVKYSK